MLAVKNSFIYRNPGKAMKARDVMTVNLVTVSPQHSVRHAAQIMLDQRISGIPVLNDDGHLVGIISEGDLLRRTELGIETLAGPDHTPPSSEERARSYVKTHGWKVADVMTRDLVVVDEETSLGRIAILLEEYQIKRVPVMRNGRIVGIVSRANLLHAVAMAKLDDTAPGDDAIRRSISTRLREDTGIEGTNLTVTVIDGVAHLWGVVNSQSSREAARVVAEGVHGVEGVVDHLSLADAGADDSQ